MDYLALPFPRGQTESDAGNAAVSTTRMKELEGRCYKASDDEHGTGQDVTLRIVRNITGGDITVANDFCQFALTTEGFGRKVSRFGTDCTAGDPGCALDDAYTLVTIPENDLFYVIDKGPVKVRNDLAGSNSRDAHDALAIDANGRIKQAVAAAGEAVVGTQDETSTVASAECLMYARPLFDQQTES